MGSPAEVHSVKLGRLGCRHSDVARLQLVLNSVEFVHTVQKVVLQKHPDVVLRGLRETVGSCLN